jgi:hypothetical protein
MFLHRHREIRAAFDGRIVGNDHRLAAGDTADAADNAGTRRLATIHAVGRKRADFQKRRGRIDQLPNAVAGQQLAAAGVAGAR